VGQLISAYPTVEERSLAQSDLVGAATGCTLREILRSGDGRLPSVAQLATLIARTWFPELGLPVAATSPAATAAQAILANPLVQQAARAARELYRVAGILNAERRAAAVAQWVATTPEALVARYQPHLDALLATRPTV
jgi:hypothetical protein